MSHFKIENGLLRIKVYNIIHINVYKIVCYRFLHNLNLSILFLDRYNLYVYKTRLGMFNILYINVRNIKPNHLYIIYNKKPWH